ncbi:MULTISPECIES: prepilin-type N-terminal cleavage/methylation domain-containing protein [Bacillaceae]|uniref:prepilin-type N-terminal cleavage/methylation domain-containing protein n=1 Tax=Bacillaceae TaxID=186817 RepID=UPI0029643964|nr:prepilin-type N-terminal cleavage/methylation domain-containing protein [Bacillus infantis]MDW2875788.1 prepilin-type N-terminal cleavage/methylation domain-containing protein [Bacillus infantis]
MIKKFGQRLKNEKGLTLIELLAVIVILGIIAAIAIPSIGGIIQKSKEDAVKADAIAVLNGAKLYVAANGIPTETLKATDLDSYVDEPNLKPGYYVTVATTGSKTTFKITAEQTVGSVTIKFNGADVKQIDAAKKGATSIPASSNP